MSVMMPRQVSTTQTAQKQRQVPVIQKVLRTAVVPQVQHGARLRRRRLLQWSRPFHKSGFRNELWSRSQTCQWSRNSRQVPDTTPQGRIPQRTVEIQCQSQLTPVATQNGSEYATGEVSEKSVAFSQAEADPDGAV